MIRIMAIWTKARWVRERCSTSRASRRQRFSQPKVRSTIQRLGRVTKPLAASGRLTISSGAPGGLANGGCGVGALVAAVGDDALQKREQPAHLLQHRQAAVAVLDVGRQDVHPEHQPEGVDDRMALASLDLLAGVVAHGIRAFPPLSALLTLWLSTTAVVGLASLPACSRACT